MSSKIQKERCGQYVATEFNELGQLPIQLEKGRELKLPWLLTMPSTINHAGSNTTIRRAEKKALKMDSEDLDYPRCKRSRSQSVSIQGDLCFFCEQPPGSSGLHEAATFQVDNRVQTCAELLEDTELLAKLSTGDMVALDATQSA